MNRIRFLLYIGGKMLKFNRLITIFVVILSCAKKEFIYPKIDELKFKEIKWKPNKPNRIETNNGIIIYLLEDHELPLIDGYIYIKAGSIYDEKEKIGTAQIVAKTLRTGGTKNRKPEEIDSIIEYTASEIEFNTENIAIKGSFSCLKENFDELLIILADILMNANFQEDKIRVEIEKLKEEIRRRNDSPLNVAFLNFTKKLRREHPSGWFPTIETVNNIKREDIIKFYEKYFAPNNLIIAIAGDFNSDTLINKINNLFGEWKRKEIEFTKISELEWELERKVYYVEKDVKQSTILIGHLSVHRKDLAFYPLIIANHILGGAGFSSRLDKKIREEGFAYMTGSYLVPGELYKGTFAIYCQTEAKNTVKIIKSILEEIEIMRRGNVDISEFKDAKEAIKNSFVFRFDSPLKVVDNDAFIEFYNLPKDYYDKYIENIDNVTIENMIETINNDIFPEKMEILVVGNEKYFDEPLSSFGEVEKIEIE